MEFDSDRMIAQLAEMQKQMDAMSTTHQHSCATLADNERKWQAELALCQARMQSLERNFHVRRTLKVYDFPDAELWISLQGIH